MANEKGPVAYKGMSVAINDAIDAARDIWEALGSSLAMSKAASVDVIAMTSDVKAISRPGL